MATRAFIRELKELVTNNDTDSIKLYYGDILQYEVQMPWDVIFKDACLKKRHEIVTWLQVVYEGLDGTTKIALRQVFPYGRCPTI